MNLCSVWTKLFVSVYKMSVNTYLVNRYHHSFKRVRG